MKRYGLFSVKIASLFVVAAVTLGFIFDTQTRADGKRSLGIIRTNSDRADDLAGDITEELWQYAAETSAKLVVKMVEVLAEEKKALLRQFVVP
jgi:hypothetical protein